MKIINDCWAVVQSRTCIQFSTAMDSKPSETSLLMVPDSPYSNHSVNNLSVSCVHACMHEWEAFGRLMNGFILEDEVL